MRSERDLSSGSYGRSDWARCHAIRLFIGGIAMFAAATMAPVQAVAAVGDVLRTIPVGAAADCSAVNPGIGTSVAVVQGRRVGFPAYPVLLVTSCLASGGSQTAKNQRASLDLLDPATGSVVSSIQTKLGNAVDAPGNGWAQLVLAANKGVLYGCGTDGSLYTINYSSGTVAQKSKPSAATSCAGLAWDPSNLSIYQSIGSTIFHFNPEGGGAVPGNPTSFSAPSGCSVVGLSVVGGVLLVACGDHTVKRLNKIDGSLLIADNPSLNFGGALALSGLVCDPVTYGNPPFPGIAVSPAVYGETVLVWSKSAATDHVVAYRAPAGMCALPPTATVFAPAACPAAYLNLDGSPKDTDGDGLWDCWEDGTRWSAIDGKPGISFNNDGNRDLVLCVTVDTNGDGTPDQEECANPNTKDLFVEIDWMQNSNGTLSHKPDPLALLAVRQAFAAAPPNGIALHFLVNQSMPHVSIVSLEPCTGPLPATPPSGGAATFDALKASFFGTAAERDNGSPQGIKTINAKLMAFRWMLFAHNLVGSTSSGCGEIGGDDTVITMAGFGIPGPDGDRNGTTSQQAGTVMHELGHNLGLDHGGADGINCKPNYLSVMNYLFQFTDLVNDRPLTYSFDQLATLTKGALGSESTGIGNAASVTNGATTIHGSANVSTAVKAKLGLHVEPLPTGTLVDYGVGVDWNNSGGLPEVPDITIPVQINQIISVGCAGDGTQLVGHNDYQNLKFNARASLDFGSGEKTSQQEQASFDNADSDGDNVLDAFGCGSTTIPCAIDVKPGETPKIISKGDPSNIKVRIMGICQPGGNPNVCTQLFDPITQVIRNTLTLNGYGVKVNQGGQQGTCNSNISNNGRHDLDCQFPVAAIPLGTDYAVLEGQTVIVDQTTVPPTTHQTTFRARQVVTKQ
jgi:hypothetical protein